MLSKEEIEEAKEELKEFCEYDDNLFLQDEVLYKYQDYIEMLFEHIDQLERENKKQNKIIDLMATSINGYDSQLDICQYSNKEEVKQYYEQYFKQYFEKKVEVK